MVVAYAYYFLPRSAKATRPQQQKSPSLIKAMVTDLPTRKK